MEVSDNSGDYVTWDDYIMYSFASKDGHCKVGSYTGNGSADGPMIHTGFKVGWLMVKTITNNGNWLQYDSVRQGYNLENDYLYANSANAEADGGSSGVDLLSSGFKIRNTYNDMNSSGDTYIYLALSDNPFKYAIAR